MKKKLIALVSGAVIAAIVLLWTGKRSAVALTLHGFRTNELGSICVLLTVTNGTAKRYAVGYATETKPASGWGDPSKTRRFTAGNGDGDLGPHREREFMVPAVTSGAPWRVTAACVEMVPDGLAKYWFYFNALLPHKNRLRLLATPEIIPPNYAPGNTEPLVQSVGSASVRAEGGYLLSLRSVGTITQGNAKLRAVVTAAESTKAHPIVSVTWQAGNASDSASKPMTRAGWFVSIEQPSRVWIFDGEALSLLERRDRSTFFLPPVVSDSSSAEVLESCPKSVRDSLPEKARERYFK